MKLSQTISFIRRGSKSKMKPITRGIKVPSISIPVLMKAYEHSYLNISIDYGNIKKNRRFSHKT